MGIEKVKYEIEHHFTKEDLVPANEQIAWNVKIAKEKGESELIIEKSQIPKCLDINVAGLRVTLPIKDLFKAIGSLIKSRLRLIWMKFKE